MRERVFPPDFPLRTRLTEETEFVLNAFVKECVRLCGDPAAFSYLPWKQTVAKHKLFFSCVKLQDHETWVCLNHAHPYTNQGDIDLSRKRVDRVPLVEANPGRPYSLVRAKYATTTWQTVLDELSERHSWHQGDAFPNTWLYSDPVHILSWVAARWRFNDYRECQPILAAFERKQLRKHVGVNIEPGAAKTSAPAL